MKQVQCRCEALVDIDVPEYIDLDADPHALEHLAQGGSPSAVCPRCGALVRAELPLGVRSASRGIDISVISELQRLSVYRGKTDAPGTSEVLLGYQELFERARILRDGLDPKAVEELKYILHGKAEESGQAKDISVLYNGKENGTLVFHVLGLKEGEAGVVHIPSSSYEKIADDLPNKLSMEPYKSIFSGRYNSFKKLGFLESMSETS
jgi:hypothetical protein